MKDLFDKIKELNPNAIYVENVVDVFGLSRVKARTLCEMAVSEGIFKRVKSDKEEYYTLTK